MKFAKRALIRTTALVLIIGILNTVFFPTVSYALTSFDTHPDVSGYQPVDATDNVSLTSGKFNYTIPITSIPEYPMAIGYSSGMGMDQEAGAYGFGFSGFSGAVVRNLMGIPDDINSGNKVYDYSNQKKWDASLTGSISPGGFSTSFGPLGVGAGVNISLTVGYNNYTGVYGAFGIGFGVGAKLGGSNLAPAGGLGASLISDSRNQGLTFGAGAGVGISYGLWGNASGFQSLGGYSFSKVLDKKSESMSGGYLAGTMGKSVFSDVSSNLSTSLAPLSYVLPNNTGFGASLSVPITAGLTLTASYSQFKHGDGVIDKKAYGFMYLDQYSRGRDQLADMTIEGEDAFSANARTAPSYMQRDFFSVNTMGLAGSMQLFQEDYGVVSRNYNRQQYRDFSLLNIKTTRKEVYPWTNVTQTKVNKGLDILALLKKGDKPEDKDFDKLLFDETERVSLTSDKYRFGKAEFKMRGDYTGEYNMASGSFSDDNVNAYQLVHVPGTGGGPSFGFLREERDMPLYYPETSSGVKSGSKIERSTNIVRRTIGDLVNAYSALAAKAHDGTKSGTTVEDSYRFNESFYSHYKSAVSGNGKSFPANTSGSTTFNILRHLEELKNQKASTKDLIGAIEMQSNNGLKYFFNLPVFNKSSKTVQLSGKGEKEPVQGGNDYESFSGTNRNKATVSDDYIYPYAWLLTAIVGDDYIDFDNIPGPSDGDIGFWVKFKYVQTSENYRWRMPFNGMIHYPGAIYRNDDDVYSVNSGTKEIYYLAEVESSNYLSKYTLEKRLDGFEAAGVYNGDAHNSLADNKPAPTNAQLGANSLYAVTRIDLYKKHASGKNSEEKALSARYGTPIKSTLFTYDYSTSSSVPNNHNTTASSKVRCSSLPHHKNFNTANASQNAETGKLTLRKVQHVAYSETGAQTFLPSYGFTYWGDSNARYNPAYDMDRVDQWGNYYEAARAPGSANTARNYYQHYTEVSRAEANENARVFNLSQIDLPSGGAMQVDYEAQSYGKVENQTPYVMRRLKMDEMVPGRNGSRLVVKVDVSDLEGGSLQGAGVLRLNDVVYGEMAFYKTSSAPKEDQVYMSAGDSKVKAFGPVTQVGTRWYQQIELEHVSDASKTPYVDECKLYMFTESDQIRAIKESGGACGDASNIISKYQSLENDGPLDAAKKVVNNVRNLFSSTNYQSQLEGCFGPVANKLYPHQSFVRTPIYKGKYTGSSVKSIVLKDNFQYSSNVSNGQHNNEYGTRYYYDLSSNGNGVSAGVATIEPGGGKSCVIDMRALTGVGFAPSPAIISSKTTIENMYQADDASAVAGDKVSRKKGKTVYEFFTAQESGYHFKDHVKVQDQGGAPGVANGNFFLLGIWAWLVIKFKLPLIGKVMIEIPLFIPMTVKWNRNDRYFMKSYSYTDYTDIFGKPKAITQLDASGVPIGTQEFKYYGVDEPVKVYKEAFTNTTTGRPGKMDQAWSEAYYTKESDIDFVPWILFLNAQTGRSFSYTSMKYSYVPPVLKEVTSTFDGMKTVTTNKGFDYYTGTPLEVESNDSYGSTKISRTVPAYWKYPEMGPVYQNGATNSKLNNLTASTGTYMYLNSVSNSNLLGVGITQWSKSDYSVLQYLQPHKVYTPGKYSYQYDVKTGATILSEYSTAKRSIDPYIKRNAYLYKPYKSYTYETGLNTNGTFQSFQDFTYPSGNGAAAWKELNVNEIYTQNGVLVQSRDILNKYASQLIGYHYSNTIGSVSNAMYGASVFEGAENMYINRSNSKSMLEAGKVDPVSARIIEGCNTSFSSKILAISNFNDNGQAGKRFGNVVDIRVPSTVNYNVPFAKVDVVYQHNKEIARSYFISMNENREYEIITDRGESFTGFFTYPIAPRHDLLVFNTKDFSSFTLDAGYTQTGYTITSTVNKQIAACNLMKTYQLPEKECATEVHSGNYAFILPGNGSIGTKYTLSPLTVSKPEEFKRKYKAMVWVHNSSPAQTELVVVRRSSSNTVLNEYKASLSSPYARAGNWSLLRVDFDLTNATYSTNLSTSNYVDIYVKNSSALGTAIYDDFRVLPFNAEMANTNYDHQFNRVTSTLDKDNFASFSNYDSRGRVTQSTVEVQNEGKRVVQKFIYNDQKKN
jgi:hypothetical protein